MSIEIIGDQNKAITPELVLGILAEDLPKIEGIVVVAFNKDGGHTLHCSCTRSELALGALLIQEHCLEANS
jgi:hypothetical protein